MGEDGRDETIGRRKRAARRRTPRPSTTTTTTTRRRRRGIIVARLRGRHAGPGTSSTLASWCLRSPSYVAFSCVYNLYTLPYHWRVVDFGGGVAPPKKPKSQNQRSIQPNTMMSAAEKQADGTVAPNDEFSWPPLESNPDVFTVREKYIECHSH